MFHENKGETLTIQSSKVLVMFRQIASIIQHHPAEILQDSIGLIALFVVLVVGLNLPGMA